MANQVIIGYDKGLTGRNSVTRHARTNILHCAPMSGAYLSWIHHGALADITEHNVALVAGRL
jgi:hypothetical protein